MSYSNTNKENCNGQASLFAPIPPLAQRIRPSSIDDVIGQDHLIANNGILKTWFKRQIPYSVILWGPPGCGKTTISFLAKDFTSYEFVYISGASTSIAELRDVIKKSKVGLGRIVMFVDEIHRLAKNQQDVLLESIEKGEVILIGTTTENPHISITRALHSRVKVFELKPLIKDDLKKIINRALAHKNGISNLQLSDEAIDLLSKSVSGDVRRLLYILEEIAAQALEENIQQVDFVFVEKLLSLIQNQIGTDENNYYDYVSALQKSIRGSDSDAAIYWLARALAGGADPLIVARRILVCASEDIGLADNHALQVATNAYVAASYLGMPEARIPLAQAVIYLANAPKSNSAYKAINSAIQDVQISTPHPVPLNLRNLGGEGYKYPHDYMNAQVKQDYLPKELIGKKYYIKNESDS